MKALTARMAGILGIVISVLAFAGVAAGGPHLSTWGSAEKIDEIDGNSTELNTPDLDGCPIQSPDGLALYLASNRSGGLGGLDIWVARRAGTNDPWGPPQNLGEPVNSAADDFCPTPVRGNGLFFVSREALPGSCGMADIYLARLNPRHGWSEPENLGCAPDGPNTALDEQGPSYVEIGSRAFLYFSSGPDIQVSERGADDSFGPAQAVAEVNSAGTDIQPNVRKDGREMVFASNDQDRLGALGGFDLYVTTRESVEDPWSPPVNLGDAVNTVANETRPSFSWDALTLLFGRAPGPEGSTDIYVSVRQKDGGTG